MISLKSSLLGALALATTALSQVSNFCATNSDGNVCGAVNVPASGTDTYFQVKGKEDAGWVAMGVGSGMAGALIFVIYPSDNGRNVTVSPRLGRGHSEPQHQSSIRVQVLQGSGISNGVMTANFKCSNCRSWSGGSLNVASTRQDFIWASGPGSAISSDDLDETITQHSDKGNFRLNLVTATGGSSVNPFVASPSNPTPSSTAGNGQNPSQNTGGTSVAAPMTKADKVLIAHGVIMALTWVLLFPLGAAFIRLLSNRIPNALVMHRTLQLFNVVLAIIGMIMGMWTSGLNQTHFTHFHQYFGVVLVGMLFVQGALGHLHHTEFQRTKKRSPWSYAHIWIGRTVIALAIINGGIGLSPRLANASGGQIAAYSIVALLVMCTYTLFYLLQWRRRSVASGYRV